MLSAICGMGMSERLKILIADESPFFRSIEKQFLQNSPAEILEVKDSDELLSRLRDEKPSLIYLSCSLLPLDGIDCCLAIKSDEELSDIPVVLVCDPNDKEQEERCERSLCDAVLVKPLDRHQFLQVGRCFLDAIREHRQNCLIQVSFTANGEELKGKGLDISSGGMFIDSSIEIEVGELTDVSFKLPGSDPLPVTCKGLVTWLNRRPDLLKPHYPTGFGVKFVGLPDVLSRKLGRLADKS